MSARERKQTGRHFASKDDGVSKPHVAAEAPPSERDDHAEGFAIPISEIVAPRVDGDAAFLPHTLSEDPDIGDGSTGREGVRVSAWRVNTLKRDRLRSASEPVGRDRRSRKIRRVHQASRKARTEKGRKGRKHRRVAVGLFLVLLVLSFVAVCGTYVFELWGGKTVPNVIGLSSSNAVELLEEHGFVVTLEEVASDTLEGHVVESAPAAGTRAEEGSRVAVKIGKSRIIPEVVGMNCDDAKVALEQAGAQNVRIRSVATLEADDQVLEVKPPVGAVFMSTDEVVLKVSRLPLVPEIVGVEEKVALTQLDKDGIPYTEQWERAGADMRFMVVRTEPEAGEKVIANEGIVVVVGDSLIDVNRLADYFDANGAHIREFLESEGYGPMVGHRRQDGHLVARFDSWDGRSIAFVSDPWSQEVNRDRATYEDVMTPDVHIEGVRLTAPLASPQKESSESEPEDADTESGEVEEGGDEPYIPLIIDYPTVSEESARRIADLCGFGEYTNYCTQDSIVGPSSVRSGGHHFFCMQGEQGSYVWTVLVRGEEQDGVVRATDAVVTCARRSTYDVLDLSKHDGRICDYVAYQDEYVR